MFLYYFLLLSLTAKKTVEDRQLFGMEQKGMAFDHDLYVVVGKQYRTENAYAGHQHNIFI